MDFKKQKEQLIEKVKTFPKIQQPDQIIEAEKLLTNIADLITEGEKKLASELSVLKLREAAARDMYNVTDIRSLVGFVKKKIAVYVHSFKGIELVKRKILQIDIDAKKLQENIEPLETAIEKADEIKSVKELEKWFDNLTDKKTKSKILTYISFRRDYLSTLEKLVDNTSPTETNQLIDKKKSTIESMNTLKYELVGQHYNKLDELDNLKKSLLEEKIYVEKKTTGKRITYTFAVSDNSALKGKFAKKVPDKEAIQAYIKQNEANITDGMEVDGVKFVAYYTDNTIHT